MMIVPMHCSPIDFDPSVLSNEIALDEALDALDPLRHLRGDETLGDDGNSQSIVPVQQRSTHNELVQLTFPARGCSTAIHVTLKVDASPGCGGITWPAGEVLASYLALRGEEYCTGRTILELGSGTGLVGLVAGKLGGKVWITDRAPLVDIMQANVKLNQLQSSIIVSELDWAAAPPPEIPRPNLILAADCVYFEPAFPLLVETLSELATGANGNTILLQEETKDKRFFILLKKEFSWKEVEDDPSRERYGRESISLLMLHRKPRRPEDALGSSGR
ncbi:putative methyltransferase-domain-containing protein [Butyriboletus roseoflavus]|nr:putative methyltransferase-domain-containing protein [Butyriboletus roseoflavus]